MFSGVRSSFVVATGFFGVGMAEERSIGRLFRETTLVLALILAAAPLEVALISRPPSATALEIRWQPLSRSASAPLAVLEAVPDETFHGAVVPGRPEIAVVHVPVSVRDASFAAVLSVVAPGEKPRTIARDVVLASKPVFLGQRLFVERGAPGPSLPDGYRVDALHLDEVDWRTGRSRPIYATRAFWTHLAGAAGSELVVYEAGPEGARLLAVHVDSLAVRTLIDRMPPMAHDFVVDAAGSSVVFTLGTPGREQWSVEQVAVRDGARRRLAAGAHVALLPTLLPGGIAFQPASGAGLRWVSAEGLALSPNGPGFERVGFVAEGLIFLRHEVPGELPVPLVRTLKGAAVEVPFPEGVVDFAGVFR